MGERVVIGIGPDALRAAAVLSTAGHAVTLLQGGPGASGLAHPDLPQNSGRMRARDEVRTVAEQVFGPLVEAPGIGRGIQLAGRTWHLPLRRRDAPFLGPASWRLPLARGLIQARKELTSSELSGTGKEERSYRDWVVRRMGEPAWRLLLRPWATRRFGVPAEQLGAALARHHHAIPDEGPHQVAGGRSRISLEAAEQAILASGGRIRSGVQVQAIELKGNSVAAVRLAGGERVTVHGPLWVARGPATVLSWLPGELREPLERDAEGLVSADLLVLCLKGEVDGLPEELHVLDEDAPFWGVVSPYGIKEYALFLSTLRSDEPTPDMDLLARESAEAARRLGIGSFSDQEPRLERLVEFQPAWTMGAHARFHRLVNLFDDHGIVPVGRTGAFSPLDPGAEVELALALRDEDKPDLRGALRRIADPPARLDDLRVSLRPFIQR